MNKIVVVDRNLKLDTILDNLNNVYNGESPYQIIKQTRSL